MRRICPLICLFLILCACGSPELLPSSDVRFPQGPFQVSASFVDQGVKTSADFFSTGNGEYRLVFTGPEHLSGLEMISEQGQISFRYRGLQASLPEGSYLQSCPLQILKEVFDAAVGMSAAKGDADTVLSIPVSGRAFSLKLDSENGYPVALTSDELEVSFSSFSLIQAE